MGFSWHQWKLGLKSLFCASLTWGAFLERPDIFSGSKTNFEIKTCWIVPQFPAQKPVNFASLSDSFIVPFSKLLKLWSWMQTRQTKNSFPGPEKLPGLSRYGPRPVTLTTTINENQSLISIKIVNKKSIKIYWSMLVGLAK